MSQLDPVLDEVGALLAARAHDDAHDGNDKRTANLHGVSRRTANRWRREGKGNPVEAFGSYMLNTPDPWRLVAHVKAIAYRQTIQRMSRAELIETYRRLRVTEKHAEAHDSALDLTPGKCWLDRSAASEADAGHDEFAAAIERRFAELRPRVTDAEILGGA